MFSAALPSTVYRVPLCYSVCYQFCVTFCPESLLEMSRGLFWSFICVGLFTYFSVSCKPHNARFLPIHPRQVLNSRARREFGGEASVPDTSVTPCHLFPRLLLAETPRKEGEFMGHFLRAAREPVLTVPRWLADSHA